ncbi:MAG: hypothetical protein EXS37_18250 [Opitutus sp.]|nr:hypothetical protein [Opitutus sp.]
MKFPKRASLSINSLGCGVSRAGLNAEFAMQFATGRANRFKREGQTLRRLMVIAPIADHREEQQLGGGELLKTISIRRFPIAPWVRQAGAEINACRNR